MAYGRRCKNQSDSERIRPLPDNQSPIGTIEVPLCSSGFDFQGSSYFADLLQIVCFVYHGLVFFTAKLDQYHDLKFNKVHYYWLLALKKLLILIKNICSVRVFLCSFCHGLIFFLMLFFWRIISLRVLLKLFILHHLIDVVRQCLWWWNRPLSHQYVQKTPLQVSIKKKLLFVNPCMNNFRLNFTYPLSL